MTFRLMTNILFCILLLLNINLIRAENYYDFAPRYIGSVYPNQTLSWGNSYSTMCFQDNLVELKLIDATNYEIVTHSLNPDKYSSCNDLYLYATPHIIKPVVIDKQITSTSLTNLNDNDVNAYGVRIFFIKDTVYNSIINIVETALLYLGAWIKPKIYYPTEQLNAKFLQESVCYNLVEYTYEEKITNTLLFDSKLNNIQSGDVLGILRLDGVDPLIAWGSNSKFGHIVAVLDFDGELHVVESQMKSVYWPHDKIQATPIKKWFELAQNADYNVVHLKLKPEYQINFTNKKEYLKQLHLWFASVEGMSYGLPNFIFSWIDTDNSNYPNILSKELVMIAFKLIDDLNPNYSYLWKQALYHRIQTFNHVFNHDIKTMGEIYDYIYTHNITFGELMSIPENDSWTYTDLDGKTFQSMVCSTFVCNFLKEGGLFNNLNINCAEFTPGDIHELYFFDSYIQLIGNYKIAFNDDFSRIKPFNNMREKCPTVRCKPYNITQRQNC